MLVSFFFFFLVAYKTLFSFFLILCMHSNLHSSALLGTGKYDFILNDAEKLLNGWSETKQAEWSKRMESVNANWEASRKHLFEQMLKYSAPKIQKCSMCNSQNAIFRCLQCVNFIHICGSCDEKIHSLNPFHDREVVFNGFYQKIKPTVSVDTEGCLVTVSEFPT